LKHTKLYKGGKTMDYNGIIKYLTDRKNEIELDWEIQKEEVTYKNRPIGSSETLIDEEFFCDDSYYEYLITKIDEQIFNAQSQKDNAEIFHYEVIRYVVNIIVSTVPSFVIQLIFNYHIEVLKLIVRLHTHQRILINK